MSSVGLITADPIHIDCHYDIVNSDSASAPKERAKNAIFDDEDKNKVGYFYLFIGSYFSIFHLVLLSSN